MDNSIKNITRNGTTFTATRNNNSTFTFTQQDNNNTYPDAIKNITRSGTTFTATRYSGGTFTFTQQDNNTYHSLSHKTVSTINVPAGGQNYVTNIPSGSVMVGRIIEGVNCAYLVFAQDQVNKVWVSNPTTVALSFKGDIYYRTIS